MDVVRLAEKYRPRGVVGVDIAGDELRPLDPRHVNGFKKAVEVGLHVTVHAAESGPAHNVKEAAETMGAERIGHGYHVLDDPKVYEMAKQKKLHFEVRAMEKIVRFVHLYPVSTSRPVLRLVYTQTPARLKSMRYRGSVKMGSASP